MQPSGALQSWMRIHRLVFRLKRCWLVHAGWYASLRLHEGHFHPEADLEFGHALSHDHQVGSEIVPDLINQGETSIALICRDTKLYPVTRAPNLRKHVTRQFPCNLIYRVVETGDFSAVANPGCRASQAPPVLLGHAHLIQINRSSWASTASACTTPNAGSNHCLAVSGPTTARRASRLACIRAGLTCRPGSTAAKAPVAA